MNIDQDAGVARTIRTGELHARRLRASAPGNSELIARHVELRTTATSRDMQREGLGTEQVIARRDIRRDLDIHPSAALIQILGSPEIGIAVRARRVFRPRVGEDLEP